MSSTAAQTNVLFFGRVINLGLPTDADAFLAYFGSWEEADKCCWGPEYLLACETAARADFDMVQK